jgi:peptidoglycan/LPS O-acetylase OafA/YrhL
VGPLTEAPGATPIAVKLTAQPKAARGGGRVAALDGVRGVAILVVLVGHAGWLGMGAAGVDVFFVLSGYLITGLLLDEKGATGRVSLRNFYARRFLRLAPALALVVTLWVIAAAVLHLGFRRNLEDAAIAVGYAANWTLAFGLDRPRWLAHTWSLCVEEQFYFLWPWLTLGLFGLLGRGKAAALACVMAAVGIAAYRGWLAGAGATFFRIYYGLDTRGDALLLGAALAFWMPAVRGGLAGAVGWAGFAALMAYVVSNGFGRGTSFVIPALCAVAILLGLLRSPRGLLAGALSAKPLAWLGMISYGVYLFHYPIVTYLQYKGWGRWGVTLVGVPLALGLAALSFYLLERPCLRWKEYFRRPDSTLEVETERGVYAARHEVVSAES